MSVVSESLKRHPSPSLSSDFIAGCPRCGGRHRFADVKPRRLRTAETFCGQDYRYEFTCPESGLPVLLDAVPVLTRWDDLMAALRDRCVVELHAELDARFPGTRP